MIATVRQESRTGLWVVISVLVVVVTFWAWYLTQSRRFQAYVGEVRLKQTLRAIKPPPGAELDFINVFHSDVYGVIFIRGTVVYSSDLEFDKVKSHYLGEFSRRGFTYQGDTVKDSQVEVHFCASDYRATLLPGSGSNPHHYAIFINGEKGPC